MTIGTKIGDFVDEIVDLTFGSQHSSEGIQACAPRAYADITVVLDKSGSMGSMQEAVRKGFNDYVLDMRKNVTERGEKEADSKWTLIQFDDQNSAKGAGEAFPHVIFEERPESQVPLLEPCDFVPRGGTALVDAVCLSIDKAQARMSGREQYIKPIMMIVTDGEENQSQLHTSAEMRERIAMCQSSGWQFVYLGANQDAFAEARKYNMAGAMNYAGHVASGGVGSGALNCFNYTPTSFGMQEAMYSGFVGLRSAVSGGICKGELFKSSEVQGAV